MPAFEKDHPVPDCSTWTMLNFGQGSRCVKFGTEARVAWEYILRRGGVRTLPTCLFHLSFSTEDQARPAATAKWDQSGAHGREAATQISQRSSYELGGITATRPGRLTPLGQPNLLLPTNGTGHHNATRRDGEVFQYPRQRGDPLCLQSLIDLD